MVATTTLQALTGRLRDFDRRRLAGDGLRPAAVAITLVVRDETIGVLLTVRAAGLRAHAGQFALPGGRLDPGERPEQAARRELDEELGVRLPASSVLGVLDDFPTRSGYRITPVVVWAGADVAVRPARAEVAEVHLVPLDELDDDRGPRFEPTADPGRPLIVYPLLGTEIYAPTAALLYQFREVALHGRPTRVAHLEQPGFARR